MMPPTQIVRKSFSDSVTMGSDSMKSNSTMNWRMSNTFHSSALLTLAAFRCRHNRNRGKGKRLDVDSWETVHPSAKVTRKDKSVGCPPGDRNSPGAAGHKQCTLLYPKKTVFREIRPLNGNFSGM